MNDWNEDRLDQELGAMMESVPELEDLEGKIIRSINKRIRKSVMCSLALVAAVVLAAVLIINPLLNAMYLNPYELNQKPEQTMLHVLRDYYETTHPYRELISLEVEKKGFARYELGMQIVDLTQPVHIGGPNVWCDMNYGVYENMVASDVLITHYANRFSENWESQEDMIQKIRELPQSAKIYLSVSDTEPKTVEALRSLPVTVNWMQVYQPNVDFNGGIALEMVTLYTDDDDREDKAAQQLLEIYLGNLENLLDHSAVWSQMQLCDGRNTVYTDQVLADTLEDAKTLTSLTSKNYCVYGQRDDVLRFLQENTLEVVHVETVRLW